MALNEYLELLDVINTRDLPRGEGRPPSDDPQVFIGACVVEEYPSITTATSSHRF